MTDVPLEDQILARRLAAAHDELDRSLTLIETELEAGDLDRVRAADAAAAARAHHDRLVAAARAAAGGEAR